MNQNVIKDVNISEQVTSIIHRKVMLISILSRFSSLAIFLVLTALFPAYAESTEKLYIGSNNNFKLNYYFQTVGILGCTPSGCIQRPSDVVISSDGSFIVVADSVTDGAQARLRLFNFSGKDFTGINDLVLPDNSLSGSLLNLKISKNDKKVVVYKEPIESENLFLGIADLSASSVKHLSSALSNGEQISSPSFLDSEGKSLIAGNLNINSPSLLVINTENDQVLDKILLEDVVRSVNISPAFDKAVVTYSNNLSQSVSIFNISTKKLDTLTISEDLLADVDDFQGRVDFNLAGDKAVLSSFGGKHVLHLLDLKNSKLQSVILNKGQEGTTLAALSRDGKTAVSAGNLLSESFGFSLYKSTIKGDGTAVLANSISVNDGSVVLDVEISPDQSKVFVLVLKNDSKSLKIFNLQDLSLIQELLISSDNADSFLLFDPLGRYAITPNTFTESSISFITDLTPGPVLTSVFPNVATVDSSTFFTIKGFIDLSRFSSDVKVCFKDLSTCAVSTTLSRDGKTITGLTPKVSQAGLSSIILSANLKSSLSPLTSRYDDIFQFSKGTAIQDTFPPEITISAPQDQSVLNSKRVIVLGKVNGTGSEVKSVLVNNNPAKLSFESTASKTVVNFAGDLLLDKDGVSKITITAEDASKNTASKTVQVTVDTLKPIISADIQQAGTGKFNVTGTVNGTGSIVSSILVNSVPVKFTSSENVNFSTSADTAPVSIIAVDKAGNKEQLLILNPLLADKTPPVISVVNPLPGEVLKDSEEIDVFFSVTDNVSVSSVSLNGTELTIASDGQYLSNITLVPGTNLISIVATDTTGNKSTTNIKISYVPSEQGNEDPESEEASIKEILTLPEDINDLNNSILDLLSNEDQSGFFGKNKSIELSNPPPIPEGEPADIELPKIEDLESPTPEEGEIIIPKGFSFVTDVMFNQSDDMVTFNDNDLNNLFTVVIVDTTGRMFVAGLGFLKEVNAFNSLRTKYKFQTTEGVPLQLLSTLNVPSDANQGMATVSVLNGNESVASIPISIGPSRSVEVKGKSISSPVIAEPVIASLSNRGTLLKLKVRGKNFVKRIAVIDGKLEKLLGKTRFLTNITFVPAGEITTKRFKLVNNKTVSLDANVSAGITPGIKLFNLITPKGTDTAAIVIPEDLQDGALETTATPEELLLKSNQ